MTDTLYRWVKASERTPEDDNWRIVKNTDDIVNSLSVLFFKDGCWFARSRIYPYDVTRGILPTCEWLEPIPSLNAGSLEEAAKKYSDEVLEEWGGESPASEKNFDSEIFNAFLAGAAYVKGDYEEVIEDHKRLVRELDEIINGKEGMAKQASLCDIVAKLKNEYVKGGEEKGLSKEEIAQICEMADNDYAAQEAILFAEFLRKNNMGPNGFGGWGGGDINTNYYGSTEVKLYELFKKRPLASRPSLDIDKVVDAEKVLDFLLTQSDLNIIDMNDGCFYWSEDKDGDQPLEPKDIIKLYQKELLNQKEGK